MQTRLSSDSANQAQGNQPFRPGSAQKIYGLLHFSGLADYRHKARLLAAQIIPDCLTISYDPEKETGTLNVRCERRLESDEAKEFNAYVLGHPIYRKLREGSKYIEINADETGKLNNYKY